LQAIKYLQLLCQKMLIQFGEPTFFSKKQKRKIDLVFEWANISGFSQLKNVLLIFYSKMGRFFLNGGKRACTGCFSCRMYTPACARLCLVYPIYWALPILHICDGQSPSDSLHEAEPRASAGMYRLLHLPDVYIRQLKQPVQKRKKPLVRLFAERPSQKPIVKDIYRSTSIAPKRFSKKSEQIARGCVIGLLGYWDIILTINKSGNNILISQYLNY